MASLLRRGATDLVLTRCWLSEIKQRASALEPVVKPAPHNAAVFFQPSMIHQHIIAMRLASEM
jgi:hypothetical protein